MTVECFSVTVIADKSGTTVVLKLLYISTGLKNNGMAYRQNTPEYEILWLSYMSTVFVFTPRVQKLWTA